MNHRYTIVTLGELLAVTHESKQGFAACAQQARRHSLQTMFVSHARWCTAAADELRELIGQLGGDSAMPGAIIVSTRRTWSELRATLSLNDDDALIDQCERGADHALEVYRNALDDHLPDHVRQVVLRQFEDVMSYHDSIRALRNEPPCGGVVVASIGGYFQQ